MEKLGGILIIAGILLLGYSLLGAFVGNPMILSFIRPIKPSTGITLANSLLILGAIGKSCCKK